MLQPDEMLHLLDRFANLVDWLVPTCIIKQDCSMAIEVDLPSQDPRVDGKVLKGHGRSYLEVHAFMHHRLHNARPFPSACRPMLHSLLSATSSRTTITSCIRVA